MPSSLMAETLLWLSDLLSKYTVAEFLQLPIATQLIRKYTWFIKSSSSFLPYGIVTQTKICIIYLMPACWLNVYGYPLGTQPRFGSFPSKNCITYLMSDTNSRLLSFGHSTEVLALLPSQKLHHLLNIWMLTQGCFPCRHSTKVLAVLLLPCTTSFSRYL